jgi:hypothetical protein
MSENKTSTITLTHSLAFDPRTHFDDWLEDAETQARHQCPQHDATGALTLVATNLVWAQLPDNITNAAQVLAGTHPPNIRARPTWDMPAAHANNAAAAVVSLYKEEAARHRDFSMASSALTTALLVSVGETNRNILKTAFPTLKTYMLSPRQVIDTMTLKHGIATSDDVSALKEPLSRALTSLSNLPNHMNVFLLASQRLTRSGQGETDFNFFKLFLETVSGFPSVALCMPGYYVQYPAILQQSLATLFPYLEKMQDHLVRSDPASPFSGSAKGGAPGKSGKRNPNTRANRTNRPRNQPPQRQTVTNPSHQHRWGPAGQLANLAASSDTTNTQPAYPAYMSEMQEIRTMLAAMTASPMHGLHTGMLVQPPNPPNATLLSSAPPRDFYCWLHGWNNTHHGAVCKIMGASPQYTSEMKSARTDVGTGGNPRIGVPVGFSRPRNFFSPFTACLPCPPTPLHTFSLPPPPLSQASSVKHATHPTLRTPALPASALPVLLASALPASPSLPNEDTRAPAFPTGLMPALPADLMLLSEGIIVPCVRKVTGANPSSLSPSVSWSSPLVTLSISIAPRPSHLTQDKTRNQTHQQHVRTQDSTRPHHTSPFHPHLPTTPSRFAHPNPFQALSYEPFPPDPSHTPYVSFP